MVRDSGPLILIPFPPGSKEGTTIEVTNPQFLD